MPTQFKKFSIPSVLATGLAVFAISACGGSSSDDSSSELAKFSPADAPVFIEGAVQPSGDVAANVNAVSEKIAGVNLGDLIKEQISSTSDGDLDFDADVKPWLGESAGIFVRFDPSSLADSVGADSLSSLPTDGTGISEMDSDDDESFGLVVQTTDTDAAQAFIDKQAKTDSGSREGEYEGFSYKVDKDDGVTIGIVDDNVVVGSTEAEFKAAVDASKGENLADTDTFSDLSGHAADGALATVYAANDPYLDALKESGFDLGGLYSALGIDLEGSGTVVSLVPESNEIALKGYSSASSDLESGDPSSVIETFPANSIFATGSGDVGTNATKIIDALNKEGIPGVLKPGQVDSFINEASGQIDIRGIVGSLETVAFFVNGVSERTIGGALVATSSDIEPIESSLKGISSLVALAGDASVRPLGGGVTGFQVRTDDLPGRPVVVGVKDDRLVVAVGMRAARTALTGSGQTLADSESYKAADQSIPGEGLDLFADPANIARLVTNSSAGNPEGKQIAGMIRKFQYLAAGSGEGDQTFELNLGLQE